MNLSSVCPICFFGQMEEFGGRPEAKCKGCGSLERTRYMFLILSRSGMMRPETSVLHFAPEGGLYRRLFALCSRYKAVDFDNEKYVRLGRDVQHADMCNIEATVDGTFDLILHNHVLEHIPCSVSAAMSVMRRRLKPGGMMLFSIPIRRGESTRENLDPTLGPDRRKREFGQWDHLRMFGSKDVLDVLRGRENNPVELLDPFVYVRPYELRAHFIPQAVKLLTATSLFVVRA